MCCARGLRRTLAVLAAWLAAVPVVAAPAAVPDPEQSDAPCVIVLVGTHEGVADVRGEFVVAVRNVVGNPVPGAQVVIDFCACPGSTGYCLASQQPDPDVVEFSSDGCRVIGFADGAGILRIALVGTATLNPGASACAYVFADGVRIDPSGETAVAMFDLNRAGGVNPVDVSLWLTDAFVSQYRRRADYDCSGSVTPADLSRLLVVILGGGSTESAAGLHCR